jgi:hypothetical protein
MRRYVALAVLALASAASAQTLKLSVFDRLKDRASDSTDLNLSKDLIGMAGGFIRGENSGDAGKIKKLLEGLNSILIKSLEFDKAGAVNDTDIRELVGELGSAGWNLIVSAEEKHGKEREISRIWTKSGADGAITGFRILSAEPKELSVIEIVGKIRLEDLKELGGLGIPDLGNLGQMGKKKEE